MPDRAINSRVCGALSRPPMARSADRQQLSFLFCDEPSRTSLCPCSARSRTGRELAGFWLGDGWCGAAQRREGACGKQWEGRIRKGQARGGEAGRRSEPCSPLRRPALERTQRETMMNDMCRQLALCQIGPVINPLPFLRPAPVSLFASLLRSGLVSASACPALRPPASRDG